MAAPDTAEEIRDVNTRYHDGAADSYDAKWGIDYGDICQTQVLMKAEKAFGKPVPHFENVLEIGAGTGYLSLNLMLAGKIDKLTATDISPGMLDALRANAKQLKLSSRVKTKAVDAETLPFKDNQFDLVMGHAILHHIPDLDKAFAEFHRVLKPGGKVFFAGEPSRIGDQIAQYPKKFATKVALRLAGGGRREAGAAARRQPGRRVPRPGAHGRRARVRPEGPRGARERRRFSQVDILGEELLANWFGLDEPCTRGDR